jgi:hypothetical protein
MIDDRFPLSPSDPAEKERLEEENFELREEERWERGDLTPHERWDDTLEGVSLILRRLVCEPITPKTVRLVLGLSDDLKQMVADLLGVKPSQLPQPGPGPTTEN